MSNQGVLESFELFWTIRENMAEPQLHASRTPQVKGRDSGDGRFAKKRVLLSIAVFGVLLILSICWLNRDFWSLSLSKTLECFELLSGQTVTSLGCVALSGVIIWLFKKIFWGGPAWHRSFKAWLKSGLGMIAFWVVLMTGYLFTVAPAKVYKDKASETDQLTNLVQSLQSSNLSLLVMQTNDFNFKPAFSSPRMSWTFFIQYTNSTGERRTLYGSPAGPLGPIKATELGDGIVFDITHPLTGVQMRIAKLELEVVRFEAVSNLVGLPQNGESVARQFRCEVKTNSGVYECIRSDGNPSAFLKLGAGELETVAIHVQSPVVGIFTFNVIVECVVGDQTRRYNLGSVEEAFFKETDIQKSYREWKEKHP